MSGILIGIMTIVALVTFLGICWWAFSAGRVKDNKQASELPFDLPDEPVIDSKKEGNHE